MRYPVSITLSRERRLINYLRSRNVNLEDWEELVLRCTVCGKGWRPNYMTGGRLARDYAVCPNNCNKGLRNK